MRGRVAGDRSGPIRASAVGQAAFDDGNRLREARRGVDAPNRAK